MISMLFLKLKIFLIIFSLIISKNLISSEIRVAVLKFGSVNWELDVISHHNLDKKYNIKIKKIQMTNKDAAAIAFLSKAVDLFVSDWVWVNKQRNTGSPFTFTPFSTAAGALLVKNNSQIKTFTDLENKKIGVAGGSLDKSWLFLRAYSIKKMGVDPVKFFKPSYAAPPLINGLALNDELDGAFNYWNYAARLEAKGFRTIISIDEILPFLGINGELPLIGYVFRESFENKKKLEIISFIKASKEARNILDKSDSEWERIKNLTGAKSDLMLEKIRNNFRNGIPRDSNKNMYLTMNSAFKVLEKIGGKRLVGNSKKLEDGTFWMPENIKYD